MQLLDALGYVSQDTFSRIRSAITADPADADAWALAARACVDRLLGARA
jgi:hypothetical protein